MSTGWENFQDTTRFTIKRRLGAGSFGVVYQAFDHERNALIALKVLNQGLWRENANALYRFKQEFRALTDVTHPNLVALYELIAEQDQWFFTMELVEGVNFLEYFRGVKGMPEEELYVDAPTVEASYQALTEALSENAAPFPTVEISSSAASKFDFDQLREILRQLAAGIIALHEAGKLHRDIKPSNVMITNNGRVVLLDFGLVTELADNEDESFDLVGTPTHMSPEQAAGKTISPASDWYSVGVMLYEVLTGRLPFSGTIIEIINNKHNQDAIAPSQIVANLPEDLNSLCVDLLSRNPDRRPDGKTVLARLGAIKENRQRYSSSSIRPTPLIGREAQLAALMQAFLTTRECRTVAVTIHGRTGMGKSTLMRYFLGEMQQQFPTAVLLTGRCYEREVVPYKALDSLIDALSRYLKTLTDAEVEMLLPADVQALARLFPVLGQVDAVTKSSRQVLEIPDSLELRRRALGVLRNLLQRLVETRPVVLFIDDLQWGDFDSVALFSELFCPPDPPAILLIASYRQDDRETSPFLQAFLPMLNEHSAVVSSADIELAELSHDQAVRLVSALLDEQPNVPTDHIEALANESGGNPFFINELVQYYESLLNSNRNEDRFADPNEKLRQISLEEVIQTRISWLTPEARLLLEIIALAGQPLERAVVKAALGRDFDEQPALMTLRSSHLIRQQGSFEQEKIETYHDRIRETIIQQLSLATSQQHYYRLANSMEEILPNDAERLVNYFQGAGDNDKAVHYALQAASKADAALAFYRAAQFYRQALELAQWDNAKAHQWQVRMGESLEKAGRGAEAARAYLEASNSGNEIAKIEFARRAAEQFLISGHIDEGIAGLRAVLNKLEIKMPETPRQAFISFLIGRAKLFFRGLKFELRDSNEVPPKKLLQIDACWAGARGLALVDSVRGADFQTRLLLLSLKAGEASRIGLGLTSECGISAALGGHNRKKTEELLKTTDDFATRTGDIMLIGRTKVSYVVAAFCFGEFKKAYQLSEQAEKFVRDNCTGLAWELNNTNYYLLRALFYLGRWKELINRLPALLKEAQERGDLFAETNLRTRMGYLSLLVADKPDLARNEAADAIKDWSQQSFHQQHFYHLFAQIHIDLYCGNAEAAWQRISEAWPRLNRSLLMRAQIVFIEAHHLRARSALAIFQSSGEKSYLKIAEQDARRMEKTNMPWGCALARLIEAGVAACRSNQELAHSLLIKAEAEFAATDMMLYQIIARCRRGELLANAEGVVLIAEAEQAMRAELIIEPHRIANMLAP